MTSIVQFNENTCSNNQNMVYCVVFKDTARGINR